jgi:hypothetical protein
MSWQGKQDTHRQNATLGTCATVSLLPLQDFGFCYPAFATIKAAMRTAAGTARLIEW